MPKFIRFTLVLTVVLALSACNLFSSNPGVSGLSVVRLIVEHENKAETFNTVGQPIKYKYTVTNTGNSRLAGPVIVTDAQRQVTCPEVKTGGNTDDYLDFNESIICTGTYAITQTDLTTGSVTNVATANVGGVNSNPSGVTVILNAAPSSVLKLTITADRTIYTASGETIKYTYVITNTGTAPLPPSQFTITDNRLGPSLNCGPAGTTLIKDATISCTFDYFITPADMAVASLTNSATASGGGVPPSPAASATVTNFTLITATPSSTPSSPSNLPAGTTVQHQVVKGEWLIQIARCYGAKFEEVRNANPQIINPHLILPAMTVTVPRIGSVSKIYGPPCVEPHTVQSGDTWESIALKYNADVKVLQARNPGALSVGRVLIVPRNSAGGSIAPLPAQPTFTPTATATSTATSTATATLTTSTATATLTTATSTATATATSTSSVPLLPDINPGAGSSSPAYLAEYKGVLYFSADDAKVTGPTGRELWKYDGRIPISPTNPSLVWDIRTGPDGSEPAYLTVYKDVLYFRANDGKGTTGAELWKYDDTIAPGPTNPSLVWDIRTGPDGSEPAYLTVDTKNDADKNNDVLYFSANNGLNGIELWKYAGANPANASDPSGAADINPAGSSNPTYLTVYKDALYFAADEGKGAGQELWKYVPPPGAGHSLVADIATAPAKGSFPEYLAVDTRNDLDKNNDVLYFSADDGTGKGVELWKYIDIPPGTPPSLVADIAPDPAKGSFPKNLTEYNGLLYFSADDGKGTTGRELWKYDSTKPIDASNPSVVADIWIGQNGSNPAYLTKYNGLLYFSADDGKGTGVELRRYP